MKKVIVALCALAFSAGAFAQNNTQQAPKANTQQGQKGKGGKGNAMKNAGVTPEEQAKLKAANEEIKAQREAIKKDASLGAGDRQAKLKALNDAKKAKSEEILGKEKAEKLREERKNKGKGNGGEGRSDKGNGGEARDDDDKDTPRNGRSEFNDKKDNEGKKEGIKEDKKGGEGRGKGKGKKEASND
jgi:Spy/CpxP family protein refolding chaperone